jgi:hypothetical protein
VVNFLSCDSLYDNLLEKTYIFVPLISTKQRHLVTVILVVHFFITILLLALFLSVFTRVSTFSSWILSTICDNSTSPPTKDMCDGKVPLQKLPPKPVNNDTSCHGRASVVEANNAKYFVYCQEPTSTNRFSVFALKDVRSSPVCISLLIGAVENATCDDGLAMPITDLSPYSTQ